MPGMGFKMHLSTTQIIAITIKINYQHLMQKLKFSTMLGLHQPSLLLRVIGNVQWSTYETLGLFVPALLVECYKISYRNSILTE